MQCNLNQNPRKLLCGCQQTDCTVYMDGQETENNQHNIKGEQQSWMSDTTQLQDLL